MIDRTFSNSLAIADIAPKAATRLPDAGRGDNGFGEALAGAQTVHDRRESLEASNSRREWAHGDHSAERTRGQERADEVRNDHADKADDVDEHTITPTDEADVAHDVDGDSDPEVAAIDADATTQAADATTQPAVTVAVAGATVATDQDAEIVPTTTSTTSSTTTVATDAVDAAMRLAIDADAAAVTTEADAAVDAEVQLALAATGTEDAETGDVEGPTRPLTSAPATTSGPSPVTTDAVDAADAADATATTRVAAAVVTDVAEGDADGATAQLVTAAAAAADGDADPAADVDAQATTTVTAAVADGDEAAATTDGDAELAPSANGRANATTHVTNPTAVANVQANAQAQARLAEHAAEEGSDAATAPKLEPVTQGPPLTAAARDAQLAAGARVRDGLLGGDIQERIDHIADQLATRLRLSQAAGGSQVQLSLRPRELGEVTVQMNVREGVVAATILVDKADTLRTLQSNIEDLKRSLENQGLSIQEFSVDVRGDAGAGGANARAAADLRGSATRTSSGSAASVAGAAAVIPGLSGDREVDPDQLHDGDVSVLA